MNQHTKEPQYDRCLELAREHPTTLGLMSNQVWHDDPRRLGFVLARYKFVAKMFSGMGHVLEVGCADAFATRIVVQDVKSLTAVDFDPLFIEDVRARMSERWRFECFTHDLLTGPVPGKFDGIYALDVLEHIQPPDEQAFLKNMVASLDAHGAMIIGMPSLESQVYASAISKEGHVNCKTMPDLKATLAQFFHNVFLFSMNDEVVHTGYHKMAHYLIALCCNKK